MKTLFGSFSSGLTKEIFAKKINLFYITLFNKKKEERMLSFSDLLKGIVIETKLPSWSGKILYSDTVHHAEHYEDHSLMVEYSNLDYIASVPIVGVAAGITRVALAVLHMLNHTLALIFTFDSRHCIHLAKGGCEFLKGLIQSVPIVGHLFARSWMENEGEWWIIKIYDPDKPDTLDAHANFWQTLKRTRPSAYIIA